MKNSGHMKFTRTASLFCVPAAGARFTRAETKSSRAGAPESKWELPEHAPDLRAFLAAELSGGRRGIAISRAGLKVRRDARASGDHDGKSQKVDANLQ